MITAVILTKNEEKNIKACIESVNFCEFILVIDDNSTDKTINIAKKLKAQVIQHDLGNDFAAQRNFALLHVKTEWTLFIDADELVSEQLKKEILGSIGDSSNNGFYIKRQDELFGRRLKYGELLGKKFLRLGRTQSGKWRGAVHEVWDVHGGTKMLSSPIIHKPHQTISEFLAEVNFYSTLRARELHVDKKKASFWSLIIYTKGKFFYLYIIKLGFLDGIPGLIMSCIMSLYTFLTRGKLFLLQFKK